MAKVSFRFPESAAETLDRMRHLGVSTDLAQSLLADLAARLQANPTPDRGFQWFVDFVSVARNPQSLLHLLQQESALFGGLLTLATASDWLAQALVDDPDTLDLIRLTDGRPVERNVLIEEICNEASAADSLARARNVLIRHRQREVIRIAYGDLVHGVPVERTCEQLAFLADAILAAALKVGRRLAALKRPEPFAAGDNTPRLAAIALAAHGGLELDYGSQIELLIVADCSAAGMADVATMREAVRHWVETTRSILVGGGNDTVIYEPNLRLNRTNNGNSLFDADELAKSLDRSGRTWQRQALVKARYAAGDEELAASWIRRFEPWVYRRYLGTADQEGIRAVKRKLRRGVHAAERSDSEATEVPKQASREIESVTQFLQFLNGTDLSSLRIGSTFRAIEALEQAGCLTMGERTLLSEHYAALRRIGHRLQLATLNAAETPTATQWELAAYTMNLLTASGSPDAQSLRDNVIQRRRVCERVVDHLVNDVFPESEAIPLETEMILDPDVNSQVVDETLQQYGIRDAAIAHRHLMAMATEPIRFLSDRRARHFLAGIAPKLLEEIAATPDPDATLERLAVVSDSLGGKAALWELLQSTPPTLRLCVRLCAASPYLTGILIDNPGMLDELIDSLILDRLPTTNHLEENSLELCRFAEDLDPILHSFKNSAHLRIGVRDLLGRDSICDTHKALADTAESCLRRIAESEWEHTVNRYGDPGDSDGNACFLTMVALGKLGGREPNYHSDLDVLFLYDGEGHTKPRAGGRREGTNNAHFFNELVQRINKRVSHYGPGGRLFDLEGGIRFSPQRHALAVPISQFADHFRQPSCPLWQRLALVNARVIFGPEDSRKQVKQALANALLAPVWQAPLAGQAAELRMQLQQGASNENIKRGFGGTLDVETLVQVLLLRHASELDGNLGVGTLEGLELLRLQGWLSVERAQHLAASYKYLRGVESNLRLMNLPARHDLPVAPDQLRWLAYAMRESHASVVSQKCNAYREVNRQIFSSVIEELKSAT